MIGARISNKRDQTRNPGASVTEVMCKVGATDIGSRSSPSEGSGTRGTSDLARRSCHDHQQEMSL